MAPFKEKAVLDDRKLFSALNPKFVEVESPIQEMWESIASRSSYRLWLRGGSPEIMEGQKELLHRFSENLQQIDFSWALDALDKAMILHQNKQNRGCYGGMPSAGWMSGPNMFGGPTAGQVPEPLPLPWAASASPPLVPSAEVHTQPPSVSSVAPNLDPAPPTGNEELLPPAERSEHAGSDTGH